LTPVLVEAMKEQQQRINNSEKDVAELKGVLDQIRKQ